MGKDLYRNRIEVPLDEKVLNFLSSLKEDLWIAKEDIIGTEAHNIMLFEQNILTENEIKQILKSLEKLKEDAINNNLNLDESFEDIHPFLEKKIIDEIGIDIGGKIHTGRSRNDQVSVDIRMKIRSELNECSKKLIDLCGVLLRLSNETKSDFMPLYTHLQRGQLGVFAHYINNYLSQFLRSIERIEEIYKRINMNPLGACAIGGTSININRKRTAELLGFNGVVQNSIDAISSRDYIYETLSLLSLISLQFSRIAEDLLIWASKEFNYIELDDQFCSVSSVMPQKRNPDTIEIIRSRTSKIISTSFEASLIIKAVPSGYFRDFQDLKMLLKKSFDNVSSIIEMLSGIFSTLKVNKDIMEKNVKESYVLALDLAELLVHKFNIPFRQTHQIVGELVKKSTNSEDLFDKKNLEVTIKNITQKEISLPENFISIFRDLSQCLDTRVSQGSPAKTEVERMIALLTDQKKILFQSYQKRVESLNNAQLLREGIIKKLIL